METERYDAPRGLRAGSESLRARCSLAPASRAAAVMKNKWAHMYRYLSEDIRRAAAATAAAALTACVVASQAAA